MENIKREIRLFFVSYGKLFAVVIGSIFIIIFIIQSLNSRVIEQNNEKYSSEEYQTSIQEKETIKEDKTCISQFIDYCNEGEINRAYDMLSDECKRVKFSTIEKFKEEYVNKVFSISICEYEIAKQNNIYIITLIQDMLITGKTDSIIEGKYQVSGELEKRIYIYE